MTETGKALSQYVRGSEGLSRNEINVFTLGFEIMTSVKPSRGRGVSKDNTANQAKGGWEASHQKEEIMTGMMTERKEVEKEWAGEGQRECWGRAL